MNAVIEQNLNAYLLSYAAIPGAVLRQNDRIAWVDSGFASSSLNSVVFARFRPEEADTEIDAVLTYFREHARPLTWHIGPSSEPADLGDRLIARGMSHAEDEPGMAVALSPAQLDFEPPTGLIVEPVRTARQLEEWIGVWLFPVPADLRTLHFEAFRRRGLGDDLPWQCYLGRVDGAPVAAVELFMERGVAGVQYVVTLPHLRRRGIGAAMTAYALREARGRGCTVAALSASPDGIGIYRRLGFVEYCLIRRFE